MERYTSPTTLIEDKKVKLLKQVFNVKPPSHLIFMSKMAIAEQEYALTCVSASVRPGQGSFG